MVSPGEHPIKRFWNNARSQTHTLEGVIGGLLVLSAVLFALQIAAGTPLTASISGQHIGNQEQATAKGVLDGAAETGALRRAILYWDDDDGAFHNASNAGYYTDETPANEFGRILNRTFEHRNVRFNVAASVLDDNDEYVKQRLVYNGVPSDDAVRATRTVLLHNSSPLYDANGTKNGTMNVSSAASFYAEDIASGSSTFNVVRVEVVVWRT